MQQPLPPQQDLPATVSSTKLSAAAADKKKGTDQLFMDHWLLLFNQQEDEDNENSHIHYEASQS
jgi:hypothetical protein